MSTRIGRRRLLVIDACVVAAALAAAAGWLSQALGSRRQAVAAEQQALAKRVDAVATGQLAAEDALNQLATARQTYRKRLDVLENLLIRAGEQYLPAGKPDPENHFKQLLVAMRERCKGDTGTVFEGDTPLGFSGEIEKEPVRLRLLRLAAVERLLAALKVAGVERVIKVEHLAVRPASRLDGLYNGVAVLPITVRFAAGERESAAFLQALNTAGTAAALENARLETTAQHKGITAQATVCYMFLDAADVLPAKPEAGVLAPRRRNW